jgi:hypothetical protein
MTSPGGPCPLSLTHSLAHRWRVAVYCSEFSSPIDTGNLFNDEAFGYDGTGFIDSEISFCETSLFVNSDIFDELFGSNSDHKFDAVAFAPSSSVGEQPKT